jgi:hypothetical protein
MTVEEMCECETCSVCNGEREVIINEMFVECFCDGTTLEEIAEQIGEVLS